MDVSLVMFKADGDRRDFPITRGRVVIGRKNTCDLRIPLSSVSRQHCEITINGDTVQLRDLGSSNGTFHNDNRIQEALLQPSDQITIGPVVFTVTIDGKPQNIQPPAIILESQASHASIPAENSGHNTIPLSTDSNAQALQQSSPPAADPTYKPTQDSLDNQIAALNALEDSDIDDIDLSKIDLEDIEVLEEDEQ